MADDTLVSELIAATQAYSQQFGLPDSLEQLQGVVGALLRAKAAGQLQPAAAAAAVAERFAQPFGMPVGAVDALIQQVVTGFEADNALAAAVEQAHQALAAQAHQYRQQLETEVKQTLWAYVQQYAPAGLAPENLRSTVESIIPLVQTDGITRAEALDLLSRAATIVPGLLSVEIQPKYLKLAQRLALCLAQKPLETAVSETVVAYLEKYQPALEAISEGLIENAIRAIANLPIEFDWTTELSLKDKRLLIQQVCFKLNLLQASPPPSKTAREVAAELHGEIERFRQERLGAADLALTEGVSSSDGLEISSPWLQP